MVIEIQLTNGRYHANPWGRHVNEGVAEWPPSPYRLIRALVDVWKRKFTHLQDDQVIPVLKKLSAENPVFHLPPASSSHIRSYLSLNDKNPFKKTLIFDAFISTKPGDRVLAKWENIELSAEEEEILQTLLQSMNYFGRSESWVKMGIVKDLEDPDEDYNCYPSTHHKYEAIKRADLVIAACCLDEEEYNQDPYIVETKGKSKIVDWFDALCMTSNDVIKQKISGPPLLKQVVYKRPDTAFEVIYARRCPQDAEDINTVIFALETKVPPSVTNTVIVSENFRKVLMGAHKRVMGDMGAVSPKFSGKNHDGSPLKGHRHVYILPVDENKDGKIDHIIVTLKNSRDQSLAFDGSELLAFDRIRLIKRDNRTDSPLDIKLIPIFWGKKSELDKYSSAVFESATPFIPPQHYRKGRGPLEDWLKNQLRIEAENHGFPEIKSIRLHSHPKHKWYHFYRTRKKDQNRPKRGYGFVIEFEETVRGPVALGYAGHFGLGLFVPASKNGGD